LKALVLDASAALHVVLRREGFDELAEVLDAASTVAAPRLYCAETANALWKYARSGGLSEAEAAERLEECAALVTHPIEDEQLAGEALTAAVRYGHPVYDAMYAVLARRLSCAVATRDGRLRALLAELRIDAV
jgi:predicted nucleic acid-binding protein